MKLYVIGIGPGHMAGLTMNAKAALDQCDVLVGYTVYLDLLRADYAHKPILTTPMRAEVARCRMAIEQALSGKTVGMVCSGDAGVYGMAGLVLELANDYPPIEIEVVPGVTAALSGAALLGAPLTHDFAVISLSDLLTDWNTIVKRLRAAAEAGFVICLYNPASKRRIDHLRRACDIVLESRSPETVCGIARQIGRSGETAELCTLAELRGRQVDMFATVFIGNQSTKRLGEKMITPRGYRTRREAP